jgi:hypothetical protein
MAFTRVSRANANLGFMILAHRIDMTNLATYLDHMPIIECHVVSCTSNNICLKDMYFKNIGLRVQNMIIIMDSKSTQLRWGKLYDHSISMRIFTVLMDKILF